MGQLPWRGYEDNGLLTLVFFVQMGTQEQFCAGARLDPVNQSRPLLKNLAAPVLGVNSRYDLNIEAGVCVFASYSYMYMHGFL